MKKKHVIILCSTLILVSCSVFNFDDYCSETNLLQLSGEVLFLKNELFCVSVNESEKDSSVNDNLKWFKVYSLEQVNFNIEIGDIINFTTVIENTFNSYLYPILQIHLYEEELLTLENGIKNYRDWYENFYKDK